MRANSPARGCRRRPAQPACPRRDGPSAAQTVDEVIAKNIEARGGKDKIAAVQTVRAAGKMTMGPGWRCPFVMEWKAPNQIRQEFTIQGKSGVRAYDGTTAWMYMPIMGKAEPEKMAAEDAADMAQEADLIGRPAGRLPAEGAPGAPGRQEGRRGHRRLRVEVTLKNGDVVHEFIDAETYLTIKEEAKHKQGDQEVEVVTSIGNYQQVDGLTLPFSISSHDQGCARRAPAARPSPSTSTSSAARSTTAASPSRRPRPPRPPSLPPLPVVDVPALWSPPADPGRLRPSLARRPGIPGRRAPSVRDPRSHCHVPRCPHRAPPPSTPRRARRSRRPVLTAAPRGRERRRAQDQHLRRPLRPARSARR